MQHLKANNRLTVDLNFTPHAPPTATYSLPNTPNAAQYPPPEIPAIILTSSQPDLPVGTPMDISPLSMSSPILEVPDLEPEIHNIRQRVFIVCN